MQFTLPASILSWSSRAARLVFFIRYALLTPTLLLLIAALGLYDRSNPLLGNVLLVDDAWQLFNLTWISLVAVALSFVEARVTLLNAKLRFLDCPPWNINRADIAPLWLVFWLVAWLVGGLCLPLVCGWATHYGTHGPSKPFHLTVNTYSFGIAGGVAFATLLMLIASALGNFRKTASGAYAELLPTDLLFRKWSGLRHNSRFEQFCARILVHSPGYAEQVAGQQSGSAGPSYRLRPGHGQLAFTLVLAIAGYFFLYWWAQKPEEAHLPVLFYLVQVLIIVGAVFTAAAFFLDRYRLPVPIVMLLAWAALGLISHNDHFFAMLPAEEGARNPPRLFDLANTWNPEPDDKNALSLPKGKDEKRTLVVVSAAGGGIQAAAWTTKVLTELHNRYGVNFTRSVKLISSVSGGSVGAMFYLANYADLADPKKQHDAIHRIRLQSQASSLETSGWGLAFHDLIPALLPIRRIWPGILRDRGSALEDFWSRQLHLDPSDRFTVRGLLDDIEKQGHPVPIFNCTNGSTGARFLWSPIKLIERDEGRMCDPEELVYAYPDWDLNVVTAARLSATFSYVSPICRPDQSDADYVPFADGGYADNEGILTVVQTLTTLLSHYQEGSTRPPFDRILVVRIVPFATAEPTPRSRFDEPKPQLTDEIASTAWRRALIGPLDVLTRVRQSSQLERGEFETVQFQAPSFADVLNWNEWTKELGKENPTASLTSASPKSFVDTYSLVHDLSRALKTGHAASPDKSARKSYGQTASRDAASAETYPPIQIATVKFVFSLPQSAALPRTGRLLKKEEPGDWDDYFTPLSWKLSPRQIDAIDYAWDCLADTEQNNTSPFQHPIFIDEKSSRLDVTLDEIFEPIATNP